MKLHENISVQKNYQTTFNTNNPVFLFYRFYQFGKLIFYDKHI